MIRVDMFFDYILAHLIKFIHLSIFWCFFYSFLFFVFFLCFFFFFQAEDGIRDHCVTGVQTCALPIYLLAGSRTEGLKLLVFGGFCLVAAISARAFITSLTDKVIKELEKKVAAVDKRSEERRVGKECRSRWAPEQ